jgi:hypothetical protein
MNNSDKVEIEALSEIIADTRRLCEIRFDCLVTMHEVAFKKYKGIWGQEKQSRIPQWFKAHQHLTLEAVKHMDEYTLGLAVKKMFRELEQTIEQYEQIR